jgi:hypothetical protein
MLKENELIEQGLQTLKECLSLIPSLDIVNIEKLHSESGPDFLVKIRGKDSDHNIYGAVKSQGTPKNVRNAVNSLLLYRPGDPSVYKVLIAPFISSRSAAICDAAGIGYVDLSGNCKINFQQVFISRENCPNKYPVKSTLSSLFFPKSERILRVLLTFPFRPWKTLELAQEAQVSPGMITHVRKKLAEEEWGVTTPEGLRLQEPGKLLLDWSKNYSLRQNSHFGFYTLKPLSQVEKEIADTCANLNIRYALTGFSAANYMAPFVTGQRLMGYIDQNIDLVANKLGLKPVDSGANVSFYKPYDEGVLWNTRVVDGIQIATTIQVYLDLINFRGRGEEAAEFLYQEVINAAWEQQKTNTITSW